MFPAPNVEISDFVDQSFLANERDCLPCNFVQSPVEFWNLKVESYFNAKNRIDNSLICYYEEVLHSPGDFLKLISKYCNISENLSIPMNSTKGDDKTFDDYQKEAARYDPLGELGETVYLKILDKLNKKTLKKTPYITSSCG